MIHITDERLAYLEAVAALIYFKDATSEKETSILEGLEDTTHQILAFTEEKYEIIHVAICIGVWIMDNNNKADFLDALIKMRANNKTDEEMIQKIINVHKEAQKDDEELMPAIPPEDYKGSQADFMVALQSRGLWNGQGWYGDVMIPTSIWWEILEECEGEDDG